jgi:Glycine-rich domain-containing protein-like
MMCSFLDLMSSSPNGFFVPTLDIDLAWHTHQLLSTQYNSDCKKYLSRYIDQCVPFNLYVFFLTSPLVSDDKVEEEKLASSFDVTCRAWQVDSSHPNIAGKY